MGVLQRVSDQPAVAFAPASQVVSAVSVQMVVSGTAFQH
jgi:hypothetical protein